MRRIFFSFILILSIGVLAACRQPTPTPTIQPSAPGPLILPLPTVEPTSASGEAASPLLMLPTPELVDSMDGTVWANSVLRSGPGLLFDVVTTFREETPAVVTGQAPGGNWLFIKSGSSSGWMNAARVTLSGNQFLLHMVEPEDALSIKGHIFTPNGSPASHLGVSLLKSLSTDQPQLDAAMSNDAGEWYLYLPKSETGTWTVRADSYGCESNAVNSSCGLIGRFPDPQQVTLPQAADAWIDFQLQP